MATWDVTLNVTAIGMTLTPNDIYNMEASGLDPDNAAHQKLYIEKACLVRGDAALSRLMATRDLLPSEITVILNTP